eukprot:9478403-Pyramimonas_sp.AAC.1
MCENAAFGCSQTVDNRNTALICKTCTSRGPPRVYFRLGCTLRVGSESAKTQCPSCRTVGPPCKGRSGTKCTNPKAKEYAELCPGIAVCVKGAGNPDVRSLAAVMRCMPL